MKLQRKINRRVGDKEYYRWYVYIGQNEIKMLKWIEGQELDVKIRNKTLTLSPKN